MKLLDGQIPELRREQPDDVLRLPDARERRALLAREPRGQLERGEQTRCLGGTDAGHLEELGRRPCGEAAERPLADLIFTFGEEKKARRIAKAIVAARALAPITSTGQLAEIVRRAIGPTGGDKIDPATRTFQALRIAVNDEMGEIDRGLEAAEAMLAPGGRMAIVSFHSLEDRRVKHFMRERAGRNPKGSRHLPEVATTIATLRLVTPQGIAPTDAEIAVTISSPIAPRTTVNRPQLPIKKNTKLSTAKMMSLSIGLPA